MSMNDKDVSQLASGLTDYVNQSQLTNITEKLDCADEQSISEVKALHLKSASFTVMLSAFLGLFGAGSLYIGKIRRGLVKIICNVVLPVVLGVVFLGILSPLLSQRSEEANLLNTEYVSVIAQNIGDTFTSFNVDYQNYLNDQTNEEYMQALDNEYENIIECYNLVNGLYLEIENNRDNYEVFGISDYVLNISDGNATVVEGMHSCVGQLLAASEGIYSDTYTTLDLLEDYSNSLSAIIGDKESDWRQSSRFISVYFTIILSVDVFIVLVYWIREVFVDKHECYKLNYNKLLAAIH